MYAKVERTERKFTYINTIYYEFKLCHIIVTIVNCSDVQQKILEISTTHRRDVDKANKYVMQLKF